MLKAKSVGTGSRAEERLMWLEELSEILEHLNKLYELSQYATELRSKGLEKDRLKKFLELLHIVLIDVTGREDLHLVKNIAWLRDNIDYLPLEFLTTFQKLKEILRELPRLPRLRHLLRDYIGPQLPELPTLPEVIEDIEVITDSLIRELREHTRTLITLFDTLKLEALPYIIRFIEENPVNLRATLGEVLGIWWYTRVRFSDVEAKHILATLGPTRLKGEEIDAVVVISGSKPGEVHVYIVEVKNSKSTEEILDAVQQLKRKALLIERYGEDVLRELIKTKAFGKPKIDEKALVTLYSLENSLRKSVESQEVKVYDANDITKSLESWRYKEKSRYIELFTTVNKLMESLRQKP